VVSKFILRNGSWEPEESHLIKHALAQFGEDVVLLDLDANIGVHTLAAAAAGYRIWAVDALERNLVKVGIHSSYWSVWEECHLSGPGCQYWGTHPGRCSCGLQGVGG
jgi:hypothetical protein